MPFCRIEPLVPDGVVARSAIYHIDGASGEGRRFVPDSGRSQRRPWQAAQRISSIFGWHWVEPHAAS